MHESNPTPDDATPPPAPPDPEIAPIIDEMAIVERRAAVLHGLRVWFGLIAGLGILSLVFNMGELAFMIVLAAVFVAAHAADQDESFEKLRLVLSAIFVLGASFSFGGMTVYLANAAPHGPMRTLGIGIAAGGAIACLVTSIRSFSDGLVFLFFRTHESNHTLRLGARVVLTILLFAIPGWVAAPLLLATLEDMNQPLLDANSTFSTLLGMAALALGAVGFMIKRDARATLERLGLARLRLRHIGIVLIGVAALYFINLGSERMQHAWFPAQYAHDQRINEMLAGGITAAGALLVGISAGVGEELAMRGALQPRLGLVLTSIAFAALHVHYSWFGMFMIFVLGMVLGIIRLRTSTSVAILVHSLYDIAAVLAAVGQKPGP